MNVVILSITVVLGMLDKVLLCAELSPGAESRRFARQVPHRHRRVPHRHLSDERHLVATAQIPLPPEPGVGV